MDRCCRTLLFLVLLSGFFPPAFASEETMGDYMHGIGTKLGRGIINVVTSPAEIPCAMSRKSEERGAAGMMTGFGQGAVYFLRRALAGVTEIGTFFIPMEANIAPVCRETYGESN